MHTREGARYQAHCHKLIVGGKPKEGEQTHPCAGVQTTADFFKESAGGPEKEASDDLPFDAVADAEHHRTDGVLVARNHSVLSDVQTC